MAYKAGELTGPFWAENSGLANGRDPLGIQNSSVATYVKLLPGITNVTSHIRYYGFYCWLLEQYISNKEIKNNNSLQEQLLFIRKAELLLTYTIKAIDGSRYNGVGGSAFVERDLKDNPEVDYSINLEKNASFYKKGNTNVYWKLRSGVFGQYYLGVLKDLALIAEPQGTNNVYVRTGELGRQLAYAFDKNVPTKQKLTFIKAVIDGRISRKILDSLPNFHLNYIPVDSEEWKFYIDLMRGADLPGTNLGSTRFRNATINFYLNFLKQKQEKEFLDYCYIKRRAIADKEFDASIGWRYYSLNEYSHVAYEHIFCSLLYFLKPYPLDLEQRVNVLAQESTSLLLKELKIKGKNLHVSDVINATFSTDKFYNNMWYNHEEQPAYCIANALLLLMLLYKENLDDKEALMGYANKNQIIRKGHAFNLFNEILEKNLKNDLPKFIKNTIYLALNDHLFSSYNKASLNQKDMFNILVEDSTARRVRDTEPALTSPRINSLKSFLLDLQLITPANKPINNALQIFA